MLRWTCLLTALVLAGLMSVVAPADGSCSFNEIANGFCGSASTDGHEVVVGAERPSSGRPGAASGDSGGRAPDSAPAPAPTCDMELGCRGGYSVAMIPDVTTTDLTSFRPPGATVSTQPAGIAISGVPVNLDFSTSIAEIEGTVLDYDVRVRFAPKAFTIEWGDGLLTYIERAATTVSVPHTYERPGEYVATVTIHHSAQVDFGSGTWRPVQGTVNAPATSYDIRVIAARTALVNDTCTQTPWARGC